MKGHKNMRLKNNILLLDTETTGNFGQPLVHDLGYIILDKNFEILTKKRFMVKQVRKCHWALDYSEFYRSKAYLYDQELEQGFEPTLWGDIMKTLKADIKHYHVSTISAYNIAFDYRALNFTNQFLNNGDTFFEELLDKKKFLCIWNLACETILQTPDYRDWARKEGFISDAGNIKTDAETVYKYLTQNLEFEEEHTALQDVLIEKDILQIIVEQAKGIPQYGLMYSVWKKVQEKK